MAWVTLHNMLEPDKNLHGTVPKTAKIIYHAGTGVEGDRKSVLSHPEVFRKPEGEARVRRNDGAAMTLEEYMATEDSLAGCIEWTFSVTGAFAHYTDGPIPLSDGGMEFLTICTLDLLPWLVEQGNDKLCEIAKFAFAHRSGLYDGLTASERFLANVAKAKESASV